MFLQSIAKLISRDSIVNRYLGTNMQESRKLTLCFMGCPYCFNICRTTELGFFMRIVSHWKSFYKEKTRRTHCTAETAHEAKTSGNKLINKQIPYINTFIPQCNRTL